jgi:hypothetical protein
MEVAMNHLPPRAERNALLPFVEARLCELVFLADCIRHVPAAAIDDDQIGIRDQTKCHSRQAALDLSHLRFERTHP